MVLSLRSLPFAILSVAAVVGAACGEADAIDAADVDAASGDVSITDAADVDAAPDTPGAGMRCNGFEELCDRKLFEVLLPGTHNAMSNEADEFIGPNQTHGLRRQLDDGIRAMLLDTYRNDDGLVFCHGDCVFGSSDAVAKLAEVRTFLDEHPHEVFVIIFEDHISVDDTVELLAVSGLDELLWVPPADAAEWPTLREMIEQNERVLVSLESGDEGPPYLTAAWDIFFDTPYSFEYVEEFSCRVNRGDDTNPLYLVNHWVGRPLTLPFLAEEANTYEVLAERLQTCGAERDRMPNVLAVDFYEIGDLFEVVEVFNGVRAAR